MAGSVPNMKSLIFLCWLQLIAPPALAQTTSNEDPLLYDTFGSKDYWKAGGKITLDVPFRFYDKDFSTVFVSSMSSILVINSNILSMIFCDLYEIAIKL